MQFFLFFGVFCLLSSGSLAKYERLEDVEDLVKQLDSPDPKVRKRAVFRLGGTGELAVPWINKIIDTLEDKDLSVAESAGLALSVLGPLAKNHAEKMVEKLKDAHGTRRFPEYSQHFQYVGSRVAVALGKMGSHASHVAPDIAEILTSSNPVARENAEQALVRMGPNAGTAASKIADLLEHENPEIRLAALRVIGHLGKHFKNFAPRLVPLLCSDWRLANAAAGTFRNLKENAESALPDLVKTFNQVTLPNSNQNRFWHLEGLSFFHCCR